MLLKQWLNNLPIFLDGRWNCIFTNVIIKVNVFIQKNIYYICNYVDKAMVNVLFRDIFLQECFFKNIGNDYSLKD